MNTEQAAHGKHTLPPQHVSMRSVLLGSSIVIWILTIFIIVTLNSLKSELIDLNQQVGSLIGVTSEAFPSNYEVLDKDGEVIYTFRRIPLPAMDDDTADALMETLPQ